MPDISSKNTLSENPMHQVILGARKFQQEIYPTKKELFKTLAQKQDPKILFVTCSDSRVDPSLITQTEPGSMFLLHNAGNIIPPYGTPYGGTGASIEYAAKILSVEHVIVCGHSYCGAMEALLGTRCVNHIPIIKQWITYAETARAIIDAEGDKHSQADKLSECAKRNVAVQINHLKTYPSVAARFAMGQLQIHGWFYHIETGDIDVYNPATEGFIPFEQAYKQVLEGALESGLTH